MVSPISNSESTIFFTLFLSLPVKKEIIINIRLKIVDSEFEIGEIIWGTTPLLSMQMVSSFISPLTGVNTSNMLEKLNFITGAVQEFVWSVSYPVLILNSWLFQPFQAKILWNGSKQRNKHKQSKLGSPFGWPLHRGFKWLKPAKKNICSDFTNFSNQASANSLDFRFRSLQVL